MGRDDCTVRWQSHRWAWQHVYTRLDSARQVWLVPERTEPQALPEHSSSHSSTTPSDACRWAARPRWTAPRCWSLYNKHQQNCQTHLVQQTQPNGWKKLNLTPICSFLKSWVHINLLTFIALCFHFGLLIDCTLPNSNFFKCHMLTLSLVCILAATVRLRYTVNPCHYHGFCYSSYHSMSA